MVIRQTDSQIDKETDRRSLTEQTDRQKAGKFISVNYSEFRKLLQLISAKVVRLPVKYKSSIIKLQISREIQRGKPRELSVTIRNFLLTRMGTYF